MSTLPPGRGWAAGYCREGGLLDRALVAAEGKGGGAGAAGFRPAIDGDGAARPGAAMADHRVAGARPADHQPQPIAMLAPGSAGDSAAEPVRRGHRRQQLGRQQGAAQQTVQQPGGVAERADQEPMIDPARVIGRCARRPGPVDPGEIVRLLGQPRLAYIERLQHQAGERRPELLPRRLLDAPPDIEIADIGIEPALAGRVAQPVGLGAGKEFQRAPRFVAARHGRMVVGQSAIIGKAGAMLQQLPQGEGPAGQRHIELQPAVAHQSEGGGGEHKLGDAPPRHGALGARRFDQPVLIEDGEPQLVVGARRMHVDNLDQ
jgi:hypothetical protein